MPASIIGGSPMDTYTRKFEGFFNLEMLNRSTELRSAAWYLGPRNEIQPSSNSEIPLSKFASSIAPTREMSSLCLPNIGRYRYEVGSLSREEK